MPLKTDKPLTRITQQRLVQAMRIDGHGVVSVHRFIAEDAGIEMIYTSSDGNKYRSYILIEHTGEVSMSQSQYDRRVKQYAPPQWVMLGLMFYVALKRYGYALPALDNVYEGDNSLIDR